MKVAIDEQALGIKATGVVENCGEHAGHARRGWVPLLPWRQGREHAR